MKRLTWALVICMSLVLAVGAVAEELSYGVKAGLAMAKLGGDDAGDGLETKAGFMVGGFVAIPMSPSISVQPELLYVQKGVKGEEEGVEAKYKLDYVEIPVLLKMTMAGESASPYFIVGPALGFKASSKVVVSDVSEDIDEGIKSTDFSAVIGAGVNVQKFLFEVRYSLGLSSIDDTVADASIKNNVFGLLAGVTF